MARGATELIDEKRIRRLDARTPYLAPQVLVDVDHSMAFMREETFGPAVGIMQVDSDEEAVRLMNDSDYGLTAAIFSDRRATRGILGDALETGTVFLNRCDYLDPAPRLDRRQEFRAGLHVVAHRLRTADPAKVLSLQGGNVNATLRGNWNYPTTIWAGPGRIAELASGLRACRAPPPAAGDGSGAGARADDRDRSGVARAGGAVQRGSAAIQPAARSRRGCTLCARRA